MKINYDFNIAKILSLKDKILSVIYYFTNYSNIIIFKN